MVDKPEAGAGSAVPHSEDPVGDLLRRVGGKDRDAFSALVRGTRDALFWYIRGLVRSEERAEDTLQETYLAVWRGASAWRGDGPGRVWLYGIARRLAARSWRLRSGEPAAPMPLDELGAAAGFGSEDPEAVVSSAEDAARVHRALDQLTDTEREVVVLRDFDGFSGPEVAALLELPLANVKTRLHRARLRLMALLREGGSDAR